MPELPEVESVRRQLDPELRGRRIERVWSMPQERFIDVERAAGHVVGAVGRRGKFLVSGLDGDLELIMHLGMTGSLAFEPADPYARAWFDLDDGRRLVFRDVRRFGRVAVVDAGSYARIPSLARLGPEPLGDAFDAAEFARALRSSTAPVKALLLGQRAVAGVGNIYADEALWAARIHPAARQVGPRRARRLHDAIREILQAAIRREGTTFRDYRTLEGARGQFAEQLNAYGRAGLPCPRCGAPLRKTVVAGRGTTFCPHCQRY